ncbi:MAG TPA: undecaprenyl-diphosphate phosphatase [Solirubrobacteraceae bacterium]|nr:undecaprenyl-diphosphate phosphatase [Solirubrobacteraceae bacterium]
MATDAAAVGRDAPQPRGPQVDGARVDGPPVTLAQAIVLGALHGPAELMPISSSGHVALVPWLLGWDWTRADPDVRKAFEVALHAGTAAALLIALRDEVAETVSGLTPRRAAWLALATAPAGLVGLVLERPIERRLGTPAAVAVGMIGGAAAMAVADRRPQERREDDAGWADAVWLGLAQACALYPGISRNGATLTAGRLRRLNRADANQLSRLLALPVIGGASGLKATRLARRGLPRGATPAFAAGAAVSFASTLLCTRAIRQVERDRSLAPYWGYRLALGGLALARSRGARRRGR